MTTAVRAPSGLGSGGKTLWRDVTTAHPDLDAFQKVQLEEACRAKDRLDRLDEVLRGDTDVWMRLTHRAQTEDYELRIDAALSQANATANLMKQLLAAIRLPDEAGGKRPQHRGPRGGYAPRVPQSGKVSSLERARQAKSG